VSLLKKLQSASSLADLADILGYTPSSLAYIIFKLSDKLKYKTFEIPKKGGGTRTISAPVAQLKVLQRRLANVLYQCQVEIDALKPAKKSLSHGFKKSHSIITNAKPHKNRRYVLNLDIADFFPSINFGRVRGFFWKSSDFRLHEDVATVIAQIACHKNSLPQGSPCSPIISNMVAHLLDLRMARIAKGNRCTYSRYADDITFSTNQKDFPKQLAYRDEAVSGSAWHLGSLLIDEIGKAGFSVNASKTRMQCRTSRQTVTGLTVNTKVNVRADYYRKARAMCNSLFGKGTYSVDGVSTKSVKKLSAQSITSTTSKTPSTFEAVRRKRRTHPAYENCITDFYFSEIS
jgi:RNA-directed DNA polymerase